MHLTDDRKAIARATGWKLSRISESLYEPGTFHDFPRSPWDSRMDAMAAIDAWHARGESRTIDWTKWSKAEGSMWTVRLHDEGDPSDEDGATFRGSGDEFCDAACEALIAAGRADAPE